MTEPGHIRRACVGAYLRGYGGSRNNSDVTAIDAGRLTGKRGPEVEGQSEFEGDDGVDGIAAGVGEGEQKALIHFGGFDFLPGG